MKSGVTTAANKDPVLLNLAHWISTHPLRNNVVNLDRSIDAANGTDARLSRFPFLLDLPKQLPLVLSQPLLLRCRPGRIFPIEDDSTHTVSTPSTLDTHPLED